MVLFFRAVLWVRYKITYKGLQNINDKTMNRPGGVLFLPNHPCYFVDPMSVALGAESKYPIRPMIVEYMYYTPGIHWLMRYMDALPVPNFSTASNSLKKKRSEQVFDEMIKGLEKGDNFLIYPAGRTKSTSKEIIGGSSGLHRVLSALPETNLVLVRVKGLWGSKFSRAWTGESPPLMEVIKWGIWQSFKNLIFFSPRRPVEVEYIPAPADFPRKGTKLEVNRYLQNWYNQPDGLNPENPQQSGDSLVLVPYSLWNNKLPDMPKGGKEEAQIDLQQISPEIKEKVIRKLMELTDLPKEKIGYDMTIDTDLGLDSLDMAELVAFLQDEFQVAGVPVQEISTVSKVMGFAAKQVVIPEPKDEEVKDLKGWKTQVPKERVYLPEGKTLAEVFLNGAKKNKDRYAIGDDRLGVMTYGTVMLRAIVLAQYIQKLPGKNIGILLPASAAATLAIFACELAGKVPVMINWTQGPRHLDSVKTLSKIETVLSSWAFIDRLENVDLTPIEDQILMLENIRREIGLMDKLKAKWLSRKDTRSILSALGSSHLMEDDPAVILFTSGTESMPKGVPLTHRNLLSSLKSVYEDIEVLSTDTFFGILPPFHSFGFVAAVLVPVLGGTKVAFYPNPTQGKKLAERFPKWGITIFCGAPTFIKGMFAQRLAAGKPDQFKTMRFCVTGSEKAPPELFKMFAKIDQGEILEGYGITECAPALAINRPGQPHKGVGPALSNVELKIIHPETHAPMKTSEQGLIVARGPNVFSGYLNPGISSPFIEIEGESWYNTGDLGSLDEKGYLTISGRLKRFVKLGGEMVSLTAIEEVLSHAGAKYGWSLNEGPSFAVVAQEEGQGRSKLTLFSKIEIGMEDVNKLLKDSGFSNLVRVSSVVKVKEIPIMGTGKINYRALEKTT